MKKIFLKSFFLTVLTFGIFSVFAYVFAQPDLGLEYGAQTGLGTQDIRITVANIIRTALGLLGIVALVIVLWGGFMWMTAGGDENRVAIAKKILFNGIVGLAIIMSSWAITSFVISRLLQATVGIYPDHCYNGVLDLDLGETGRDCGGPCPTCPGDTPFNPYGSGNYFKIKSVPLGGQLCVANYHPVITFNYPVNLETVQGKIRILDVQNNPVEGSWTTGGNGQTIIFSATGDCGDGGLEDCFPPNAPFTLDFTGANGNVESTDGKKLVCAPTPSTDKCLPINFITGSGVDRQAPTVQIFDPGTVGQGDSPEIEIEVTDDIAVQNVSLYVAGKLVGSKSFDGCQQDVTARIIWNTTSLQPGQLYTLVAEGLDQASQVGNDSMDVRLLPAHCFDNVLDEGEEQVGPPACGGDCGACPGGACQYDHQCAGGLLCVQGTCTKVMRILGIDPSVGAPKNYMAIFGENFGTTPGTVWFSKVAQPNKDTAADWAEAQVVTCGTDTKNWFNDQIVVEVPEDFNKDQTGAAIMVSGNSFVANTIGDGTDVYSRNLRFIYDSALANRPSLCMVNPDKFSSFQNNIRYIGKEFGTYNSNIDRVYLNVSNDEEDKLAMTVNTWGMVSGLSQVQTQAPRLENGSLTTYVLADNTKSNSLRVRVNNTYDSTAPIIDSVTPRNGAKGEYITITGNNFGSQKGSVRFYKKPVTSLVNNNQYFEGGFDFMDECLDGFWTDKKIIVKVPKTIDLTPDIGDYAVVVFNSKGQNSILQNSASFNLENTTPKPSICKVKPTSGPVNSELSIYGENFGNNKDNLKIYFWKNGAVMSSFDNRASTTPQTLTNIKGGQQLTGVVPFAAMSGELLVERIDLQNGFSNPLNFTVKDCTNPGESCATGEKCCGGGDEKGVCKPVNELCLGEIRSTGYMWRFTTKTFPKAPKVVVRCSPDDSTVPTPAPNRALSQEAEDTCLTADITTEISTNINPATVNNTNFRVYECIEGPEKPGDNFCKNIKVASVFIQRQIENNSETALITGSVLDNNNKWQPDKWYQVVLTQDIRSNDVDRPQRLEASKPCDNNSGINNTAYCYVFKTGDKDCVLSSVAVSPNTFITKFLEAPVLNRKNKNEVETTSTTPAFYFSGKGIGDHCIAMNMSGYTWSWSALNPIYANIFGATDKSTATVSALANTIGVSGLSDDSAKFAATAFKDSNSKTGNGALIVDLTNPEIIDYAPNCLTACTNADVFAKFNLPMSNSFSVGSVRLLECRDGADCTDTQPVSNNFSFTESSGYQNLELNFGDLATNTFYIVQITSGTLFTAGSSTNNAIIGSPFRQNFTWRFRTKDKICTVDRINVLPKIFNAYFVGAKTIYNAEAYSSPDECSTEGQKLRSTDYNWSWVSLSPQVAITTAYKIIGKNPFCTSNCLKRGSVISSGVYTYDYPMCGNAKVEAGEDCDPPGVNCGLNCLTTNKNKTGSLSADKVDPKDINAPVCGDGKVSPQEDCDLGITANSTQSSSSMFCSTDCLHTGTRLSSKWCSDNYIDYHTQQSGETSASFTLRKKDFENNCTFAISQCGNDIVEPDEDCEGGSNCNLSCLFIDKNKTGSSLFENPPSVCGDGSFASNEDTYCETQLFGNNNFISPWALATAVGEVFQAENPVQTTQIRATLTSQNKTDFGVFNLICGYTTDEQCQAAIGTDYGVGKNSCCYPRLSVSSTYPENGSVDVCPNTEIKISFENPIDPNTIAGNLLIAKDYKGAESVFCTGTQIIGDASIESQKNSSVAWYQKIWKLASGWLQKLFGTEKAIAQWCTGETIGTSKVVYNSVKDTFDIVVELEKALTGNTTSYRLFLTNGIKDDKGVSIIPHQFTFTTWDESDVCKVGAVTLEPDKVFFTEANSSTALLATARATPPLTQAIQPTSDYFWNYIWSKDRSNSFMVNTQTTGSISYVTSTNQNGEGEVYVIVSTTEQGASMPNSKSKITVNLCENPWPPFEANGENIWPFEDKSENKDYFDFSYNPEVSQTGFNGLDNTQGPFTNFSTYYCADAGVTGIKDDLPYLKPIVSTTAETNLLKYYFLTNDKNADAIGVKVFSNPNYLTLTEWLSQNEATVKGSYNLLKIDGYEAAVDATGNNVYIAALNYSLDTDQKVYSNIYSFNLSVYPEDQTKQVFDQILTNLKFNINLPEEYNLKLCASDYDWSSGGDFPSENCNTDLDCLNVVGKPVCLNQKEKIQRNYQRIQDARFVSTSLANYYNDTKNNNKYPNITQTYLPDRAMSIWQSSWVEFGNKLGKPLPLDPINKLAPGGTCFLQKDVFCINNYDCGAIPSLTGQVGYWAGENNFKDSSVRENEAQGEGVSFSPGVGRDFAFNFSTGFEKMTINHQEDYDIDLDNFAISFWFKPTEQTPAVLIKKGGWSDTAPNNTLGGFMVEYNKLSFAGNSPVANNGTIRFAIFPSSTDSNADKQYFAIDTQNPLALNKWHHILVRYSNTGLMYMVVDGNEFQTVKTGSLPHTSFTKSNIKIGKNNEDIIVGEGLKGQMDEIYFYARTGFAGSIADYNKKFENICHLHDATTGWSAEDLRLSFACADKSMAYNYRLKENGDYVIRGTGELDNLSGGAWLPVWNKFGFDTSKFILTSFCEDTIISGASGLCGNGVVNAGEECDYTGEQYSGYENCSVNSSGGYVGNMTKSVCNDCSSISNSTVSCATVAAKLKVSCGDGKIQANFGEVCDDGDNNGSIGFCGINCQLVAQPVCGNGDLDFGEYCDTDTALNKCVFSSGIDVQYEDVVAYFLIDISGSMLTGSRWNMITSTLPSLGNELMSKGVKFGSAIFSSSYYFTVFLKYLNSTTGFTNEILPYKEQVFGAFDIIKNYLPYQGGTPTGDAISYTINNLFGEEKEPIWQYLNKNLIIVTDGVASNMNLAVEKIKEAGSRGIRVSIFGVDYSGGAIAEAAEETGGVFEQISGSNGQALAEAIMEAIKNKGCQEYSFSSGHSCAWNCKGPGGYCGDGKINGPEECDDGFDNGPEKKCNQYCQINETTADSTAVLDSSCGDGELTEEEITEGYECDNGVLNGTVCTIPQGFSSCSWCSSGCKLRWNECPIGFVANQSGVCNIEIFRSDWEPIPGL